MEEVFWNDYIVVGSPNKSIAAAFADGIYMFNLLRDSSYPIGVDMADDSLKIVQLGDGQKGISLLAAGSEDKPENIEAGSGDWQRWAVEAINRLTANGRFRGRNAVAAMPTSELFIDHIKMPKTNDSELQDAVFSRVKQKLPFDSVSAVIKYIPADQNCVVVMATQREKIDRHLAIYEKVNLQIKSINVWPMALVNSYIRFFGRRKTDEQATVCLLDVEPNCTNVVICRHKNLLFARSIAIGTDQLDRGQMVMKLVSELTGCRRYFGSIYRNAQIEQLIFLSCRRCDKDIYTAIAKQLEAPARQGDCLAAVEAADPWSLGIDRRDGGINWTTAFGLSLS